LNSTDSGVDVILSANGTGAANIIFKTVALEKFRFSLASNGNMGVWRYDSTGTVKPNFMTWYSDTGQVNIEGPLNLTVASQDSANAVLRRSEGDARWGKYLAGETSTTWPAGVDAGGLLNSVPVTFPVGKFAVAPVVVANLASAVGGTGLAAVRVAGISTAGFTIYVYNHGTVASVAVGTITLQWIAMAAG
jgi:hypothetical protein